MKRVLGAVLALILCGCGVQSDLDGPTPLVDDSFVGSNSKSGLPVGTSTLIDEFYRTAQQARLAPTSEERATMSLAAFNNGAAVMNARCQIFFRGLGLGARNLSFAQSQLQMITGALTTVLALVSASQVAVASVAAGSTALLAGMKQFGDSYYFSVDVASVEELVVKSQTDAMAKVNVDGNGPADFPSMISMLVSYQSICQPHTIRRLINVAVSNGKPITQFSSPSVDRPALPAAYLAKVNQDLGTSFVTTDQQIAIIAVAFDYNSTKTNPFACGYVYKNLTDSFILPRGVGSLENGGCPSDAKLSDVAPWPSKRNSFNAFFRDLHAATPAYWGPLMAKAASAKSLDELNAFAADMPKTTGSGGTPTKGRVGGFTVTVR